MPLIETWLLYLGLVMPRIPLGNNQALFSLLFGDMSFYTPQGVLHLCPEQKTVLYQINNPEIK